MNTKLRQTRKEKHKAQAAEKHNRGHFNATQGTRRHIRRCKYKRRRELGGA